MYRQIPFWEKGGKDGSCMEYVIGIDLGTSGTKTVLFDREGRGIASALVEYPLYQERNGWAEQDPQDWWNAACQTLRQVTAESGVAPEDIKGVGISGQMHGLVMLDKEGKVLRRSIIWCDQRTAAQCEEITQLVGKERLIQITANPALTGFTASKILWVRENQPELYARCAHILLPKDYVRYMLTGEFATEVSDASGMQLLDVPHRQWSQEVLEKLGIDPALLGKVYESPEVTGEITKEAAALTGLKAGTPVVGGAGDNAAAAVGTGVVRDGRAFTTIGTSGVVFAHTDQLSIRPPRQGAHLLLRRAGCLARDGGHPGGRAVPEVVPGQFLRQRKGNCGLHGGGPLLSHGQGSRAVAHRLQPAVVPALPHGGTHASPGSGLPGAFFGLSAMHTRRDLLRAVMEGVTYSLRDCVEILRGMGVEFGEMLACGGGGSSPLWRQMLADTFQCPVKTVKSKEGPALGVAILAGVGAGLYPSVQQACDAMIQTNPPQDPIPGNVPQYEAYYQLYRTLYPAMKESFQNLAKLG